jgi:hypothetical protein
VPLEGRGLLGQAQGTDDDVEADDEPDAVVVVVVDVVELAVGDVIVVVEDPSTGGVVVTEAGTVVGTKPLAFGAGGADELVVVDFVELGLSGEIQPTGGTPEPVCPGIRTVPAQPKFEKVASSVEVPPSANVSTDLTCRMKPAASIDIAAVLPV